MADARASFDVRGLRGSHFPFFWHYHPQLELDLILEGQGVRFIGDSVDNFEEGDLCLMGPNLPHTWNSIPQKGKRARSIFIQFAPDCLGDVFLCLPEMRPIRRLFRQAARGLQFKGETRQAVSERLVAMSKRRNADWMQISDFIAVLGLLAESREATPLTTGGMAPGREQDGDRRLARVLDFMNADPRQIPPQEIAARQARLSPPAFSRFFRRCLGKTYVRYRNELRVSRACRLLLDTEHSITQIALDAGFENLSNFNAQFLTLKGMTPRSYRRTAAGHGQETIV